MIASEGDTLSTLETLRLGAAQAYYSVSRALRLNKVTALLQRAELSVDSPVFLLGRCYDPTTVSSTSSPQGPEDFSNREVRAASPHCFSYSISHCFQRRAQ